MTQAEYSHRHYLKNKPARIAAAKRQRMKLIAEVQSIKDLKPCVDCGIRYRYWIMQFDHRPGTEKVDTVNRLMLGQGRSAIMKEIEKCDVVCANCHAQRTFLRQMASLV